MKFTNSDIHQIRKALFEYKDNLPKAKMSYEDSDIELFCKNKETEKKVSSILKKLNNYQIKNLTPYEE